jgi:hypothetical protein
MNTSRSAISRLSPTARGLAFLGGPAAALLVAGLVSASEPPPAETPGSPPDRPAVDRDDQGPPPGERRFGPGERRGFGPARGLRGEGELGEGWPDVQRRVMEVLRDVNPAWATAVEERMAADPEGTRRGLPQGARRIMALAVLKERNPALYELKVGELRKQGEVREIAVAYHAALEAGDQTRAAELASRLEQTARESVEIGLKARAEELAALERTVQEFREELAADSDSSDERTAEIVERMTKKAPSGHPLDMLAPRGGRGEGEGRGGPPPSPPPAR